MKTVNLTLAALLLLGAPVLVAADEDMPKDRSVWDRIGENDVRVVGEVTYVYDDSFELRTPDEVMTFPIPDQDGVMAALEPGERIQVWYDPADLATGSTARVTYIERF